MRAVAFTPVVVEPSRSSGPIDTLRSIPGSGSSRRWLGAVARAAHVPAAGHARASRVFILAVTIAAVSGGLWAGVWSRRCWLRSPLPIVEYPDRVLRFDQLRDLIAAGVVFLAIAVVVRLVVGNAG